MTIRIKQKMTLLLLAALTACGGGGGGGDGGGGGGGTTDQSVTATGLVTVAGIGTPVEGAIVDITLTTPKPSANSGSDGRYSLALLKNELPEFFAGTVNKANYLPGTVFFRYANGQLQPRDAGSNDVALVPIQPGQPGQPSKDVVFLQGTSIVHLGDGLFEGTANSQFQAPVSALIWKDSFIPDPAFTTLTVTLYAHGVETPTYCDEIVLGIDLDAAGVIIGGQRQPLLASPVDGSFNKISHTFTLPALTSGANAYLQIFSRAKCTNATAESDDFEVVSVVGELS